MDTAHFAQQSDRTLNPHFRRRWNERFQPRPAPSDHADAAEPALAVVLRWRDEWRRRRTAEGER